MIELSNLNKLRRDGENSERAIAAVPGTSNRSDGVDAARGFGIICVIIYHFCFDLNYYNMANFLFYNMFWTCYQTIILSLFVFVAGMSIVLAAQGGIKKKAFLKRFALLIGCAAIISIVSFYFSPDTFIFFGIIHFIAVASLLGLVFSRFYWLNLLIAPVIIVIGATVQNAVFDHTYLQWIGLVTSKPYTDDYVPLLPWFGVVQLGIFSCKFLIPKGYIYKKITIPGIGLLRWLGRHTLIIYVVHQPILMGLLWAVQFLFFS